MAIAYVFSALILCGILLKMVPGLLSYTLRCYNSMYRAMPTLRLPLLSLSPNKPPKGLPTVEPVEQLSPIVLRILGMNPGAYTLQGTNTYLVGNGKRRALVDTGERRTAHEYVPLLLRTMQSHDIHGLSHIILTHHHGDHVGGVEAVLYELKQRGMFPMPVIHQHVVATTPKPTYSYVDVSDGVVIELDCGSVLTVMHTPGHTSDHISLLVRPPPTCASASGIFTGDCILGCGSAVFDDLHTYMTSLYHLRSLLSNPHTAPLALYPGHGPAIPPAESLAKVDEYIAHRTLREEQILAALSASRVLSSWSIMSAIYPILPFLVQMSAQWNVLHHLEKLKKEGKVVEQWPDLWKAS